MASTESGKSGSPASLESVKCSGPTLRIVLYIICGSTPSSGDSSSQVKLKKNSHWRKLFHHLRRDVQERTERMIDHGAL